VKPVPNKNEQVGTKTGDGARQHNAVFYYMQDWKGIFVKSIETNRAEAYTTEN
jgi:hypothetical protein